MENREKQRFIRTAKDYLPKMAAAFLIYGYASVLIYNISSTLFFILLVLSGFILLKMDHIREAVQKINSRLNKLGGASENGAKTKSE